VGIVEWEAAGVARRRKWHQQPNVCAMYLVWIKLNNRSLKAFEKSNTVFVSSVEPKTLGASKCVLDD